jgi:transposase
MLLPSASLVQLQQQFGLGTCEAWWRQDRIDRGLVPGLTSAEKAELVAARRRIAQLETELVATRRAAELLRESADPKGGSRRPR